MADLRLRRAARAAGQGGVAALAEHLQQRVRTGVLPRERLELAAWLGDPAARAALGRPELRRPRQPAAWIEALVPYGAPVLIRALLAAVTIALPRVPEALESRRLRAVEDWLDRPGPLAAERTLRVAYTTGVDLAAPRDDATAYLAEAAWVASRLGAGAGEDEDEVETSDLLRRAEWTLGAVRAIGAPSGRVIEAMHEALLGWALGEDERGQ